MAELNRKLSATDEQCEAFVKSVCEQYPGLIVPSSHWGFSLISIINRVGYVPNADVCVGRLRHPPHELDAITIVQKHLSNWMLDELLVKIQDWVDESPDAITITDENGNPVEGAIVINGEGKTLAYQEREPEVTHSASEDSPEWGSW